MYCFLPNLQAAVLDNLLTSLKFVLHGMGMLRINLSNKKNKVRHTDLFFIIGHFDHSSSIRPQYCIGLLISCHYMFLTSPNQSSVVYISYKILYKQRYPRQGNMMHGRTLTFDTGRPSFVIHIIKQCTQN